MGLICKSLSLLHLRMLCAKFGWNWPSASGEDFSISSKYFRYFLIISPFKRAWLFICTNLNPLHPRILCAKFGWNWPRGSGEEDENVKSLQTADGRTHGRTTGDQISSLELSARVSLNDFKILADYFKNILSLCSWSCQNTRKLENKLNIWTYPMHNYFDDIEVHFRKTLFKRH